MPHVRTHTTRSNKTDPKKHSIQSASTTSEVDSSEEFEDIDFDFNEEDGYSGRTDFYDDQDDQIYILRAKNFDYSNDDFFTTSTSPIVRHKH